MPSIEHMLLGLRVVYSPARNDVVVLRGEEGAITHVVPPGIGLDTGVVATARANYIGLYGVDADIVDVPLSWERQISEINMRQMLEARLVEERSVRPAVALGGRSIDPTRIQFRAPQAPARPQPEFPRNLPRDEVVTRSDSMISIATVDHMSSVTIQMKLPRIKLHYKASIELDPEQPSDRARMVALKRARLECFKYMQKWLRDEFERHKAEYSEVATTGEDSNHSALAQLTVSNEWDQQVLGAVPSHTPSRFTTEGVMDDPLPF